MYQYPEIKGPSKAPHEACIAFEKLDGSNMRFEWSPKRGWYKFGSRSQLIDASYPILGQAIPIFMKKYAEPIERLVKDSKPLRNAQCVTAFCEFFGFSSFAGQHVADEPKNLVLFDFHVHKKGLMGPTEFVQTLGGVEEIEIPRIVYQGVLNESLIQDVRDGKYDVPEGVVCKGGSGHKLWMRKIKTQAYIDRLKNTFGEAWQKYGE